MYDPTCGSCSLLIRAADEAPHGITIYGQEYDPTTAGLATMNLVLHNKTTGTIASANTLADPRFKTDGVPDRYDFAVSNPPFSYKSWSNGVDTGSDIRFQDYGAVPPEKNGDYAWLMHFIYSLKPEKGNGAIILPHSVLFCGNAEAVIRTKIIERRIIKGIIGLPANLFYGTGIPACILVMDKENTARRKGIFMLDAIHRLETERDEVLQQMEELRSEHGGEDGLLSEVIVKDKITVKRLKERIKEIQNSLDDAEELIQLQQYEKLLGNESTYNTAIRNSKAALEQVVLAQYSVLTLDEIKELVIDKKWCDILFDRVDTLYSTRSHRLAECIIVLSE